ncbi:carbohydrate kinase family protein [Thermus thermamylovorans]|uniref:Carbohydrate kinase n=1 Tax=Thermus thermamylovorans TaxID=2509362 RepID=A0A4V2IV48_9DEIN|nr:carbohydrate kinase [Thermus thermamylovorans]TBH20854.1 carbohydrate kinase [Thermus thermamylovorans]
MLAVAGEVLVDLILENEAPLGFSGVLGGSALNTATALSRLGFPVRFFSEVGEDWLSRWSEAEMQRRGLEVFLQRHPDPMPLALVRLKEGGNALYSFHRPFRAAYRPEPGGLKGVRAFHFGSLFALEGRTAGGLEALLREALAEGALLSYDPNLRGNPTGEGRRRLEGYLAQVDLLKLSLEDAQLLFPEGPVEAVKRLPPPLKVLTLGAEGAVAFLGEEAVRLPGEKVAVADTVGAGDAFTAGLLALLLPKGYGKASLPQMPLHHLEEALKGAIALSALACTVRGAYLPEEGLRAWRERFWGGGGFP